MKAHFLAIALCGAVAAEPMMVTDTVGNAPVHLLQKLADKSELDLNKTARVTLTSLKDGSRVTLRGPVKVRLDTPLKILAGKPAQVVRQAGRGVGSGPVRAVSLTMGGEFTRDAPPFHIQSAGQLLRPHVQWVSHPEATEYRVELLRNGTVVQTSQVAAAEADMPLQAGTAYQLRVTAQRPDSASDALKDLQTRKVAVRLLPAAEASLVRQRADRLWAQYRKDKSDLSPLMVLMSEYLHKQLYAEALALLPQLPSRGETGKLNQSILRQVFQQNES